MKYNIKLAAERIRKERESMRCRITRDRNDNKIVELVTDQEKKKKSCLMTQGNLLIYMRQLGMDTVGRNKLSLLENGDETAFYSLSINQWKDLAQVFNKTIDYITGKEPYPTPTIKDICLLTGLSVPAAELLEQWNYDGLSALIGCLSALITDKHFKNCLNDVGKLQELYSAKSGNFDSYMDVHQRNQTSMDLQGIPYTTDAIVRDLDREIKTEKYNLNLDLTNMIDSIAKSYAE